VIVKAASDLTRKPVAARMKVDLEKAYRTIGLLPVLNAEAKA
jgi:hypothetical protein